MGVRLMSMVTLRRAGSALLLNFMFLLPLILLQFLPYMTYPRHITSFEKGVTGMNSFKYTPCLTLSNKWWWVSALRNR